MTWTRRVFLKETIRGWLALVLVPGGYAVVRRWLARSSKSEVKALGLGTVGDFKPGSSRVVMLGDDKVIVARLNDGTFHAVSGVCTHLGCSIRLEQLSGQRVEFACNCHNSRFDIDGTNLAGPAPSPLRRFEVEASGMSLRLLRSRDTIG